MIYTDNHLTVTLTRQPNGLFLCDKPIEEIKAAKDVFGNAYGDNIRLHIRYVGDVFEGFGFSKDNVYLVTFQYEEPYWRKRLQTIKKITKKE